MSQLRGGKPYIHVTWLAKLLGGAECQWRAWFAAHHRYDKFQEDAFDLASWSRDHNRLMQTRRQELEEAGWTVTVENQNSFKLEGTLAVVAGKPDIVATQPGRALIVDGKTGRQRDSDIWQVLLYLYALPKCRPELAKLVLEGEVQYSTGDERLVITPDQLTPKRMADIVDLIKAIANATAPKKVPSRGECRRCDIGAADCPQRVGPMREETTLVAEF